MKLNVLPFSRRSGTVLVCETDGFGLRGAVIQRQGEALVVACAARSQAHDFRAAVAEMVEQLRDLGWKDRNGRAALLMPGVVSALIDLPVPPDKPRAPLQMQELVRWELEPLLMEHTTLWSVGYILVGLGYLTETQAHEVLERQQGRFQGQDHESRVELYSLKRFGELAIEQGFITRQQLEEALTRQTWLRMEGGGVSCGWSALPQPSTQQGPFQWLASGVNQGLMQRWAAAFSSNGVRLETMFPVAGCAAALVAESGNAVVLEIGGGQVVGTRFGPGGLEALLSHESSLNGVTEACLETWHRLTPPEPERLWLGGRKEVAAPLVEQLSALLGREVRMLQIPVAGVADEVTAGMAGAACQLLGMAPRIRCCGVPTRGPRLPLRSYPAFRLMAGGALIVAGIGIAEGVLQVRQTVATATAEKTRTRAAELDAAMGRVQTRIDAVKKLKDDIKAKQDEAARIGARVEFLGSELPRRAALLRSLFDELEKVVTDAVVIDRFAEEPGRGIVVSGWALTENAAQQFAESLRQGMESWGMTLVEVSVAERIGRLSLPGYAVSFRIVDKATASALAAPAVAAPQPAPVKRKSRRGR